MAYNAWSVVFGEQPSTAKWNILGANDASFADGTGIAANAITSAKVAAGFSTQIQYNNSSAVATGTTTIPFDDTIPQNTEGDQYFTQAITPQSATNLLRIEVTTYVSNSAASQNIMMALFQDTTASALAVTAINQNTATSPRDMKLSYVMVAGTTSATTFKIRIGGAAAGTTTVNGYSGGRTFGAIPKTSFIITEHKA